ncbi:hypothetical protein N7495_005224 [Penicillium taxi]|uniref:uncharacterized protein n=1 Tax=Penicillium taxi TaxID=168475 RepID=UPI002545233C|nr:uncharacterized protein N7495_005224 [Penicillium taxi]KAJ5893533.1 hypothetical protein N7495_005224 [Penicillium taxi]
MTITHITKDDYAYDLGKFGRSITTNSPEAQTWFNRGLTWVYTFNHTEAAKCFEQAIAHDNSCAIAYWGLAYSRGPNYNLAWESFGDGLKNATKVTYEATQTALSFASSATPIEQALINAIQARFQNKEPVSMEQYRLQNVAYADAMEAVYNHFGEDLDVAVLTADSMMSLSAWKLWNLKTGKPNPGTRTLQVKEILEKALRHENSSQHPGLLHLYIHLVEMSPNPELGLVPGDHLRDLIPDSGHACHMPSHLDVLVGDYRAAIRANQKATIADEKYVQIEGVFNFYSNYRMHNYHTLIYAAMFAGQKAVALDAVDRMEGTLPKELLAKMPDFIEVYMSVRAHVMVRFGMWDEIIARPLPDDQELYCVTTATTQYAKGVAYAATGNIPEAEKQRELYHEAAKRVPTSRLDFPNKCVGILGIAAAMLDGEIEYRRGNYAQAFEHLRHSVELDDGLGYSEPWSWMQPSRHALAALLLEQNHVEEAAEVYRCDLGLDSSVIRARQHPNNVWALQGYHECLVRLGRTAEARYIEPQLRIAIAVADVPVKSSCLCRKDNTRTPDLGNVCSRSCH